jgi:hypothetical protein
MYLFLDTEFTDFLNCDLISVGIVSEDGRHEFYVEITDYKTEWSSDYVKQAIVPLLEHGKYGMTFEQAGAAFKQWFEALPDNHIEFIVDYAGDAMLMNGLVHDHGPTDKKVLVKLYNDEFRRCIHDRGFHRLAQLEAGFRTLLHGMEDYYEQVDNRRHHALVDAKANRHGWLKGLDNAERA